MARRYCRGLCDPDRPVAEIVPPAWKAPEKCDAAHKAGLVVFARS